MSFSLNWKELELLAHFLNQEASGLFLERIIVPARPEFPNGFLKKEWAFRFTGRNHSGVLLISLRPQHPYVTWMPGKGPKAAISGTRSAFDLEMNKTLKGARLIEIESIRENRFLNLWFSDPSSQGGRLGLVLLLIPTSPEGILVSKKEGDPSLITLVRSRLSAEGAAPFLFQFPSPPKNLPELEVRKDGFLPVAQYANRVEQDLRKEAFSQRVQRGEKHIQTALKQATLSAKHSLRAKESARQEPDWQYWGDLLKGEMGKPIPSGTEREVLDYETNEPIQITVNPNLSIPEQVGVFYRKAKRNKRKLEETEARYRTFMEKCVLLEESLAQTPVDQNWKDLEAWESRIGVTTLPVSAPGAKTKKGPLWLGRTYHSKEGLSILVGKDRTENLELTFKHARGNDLWLHVRGRPGSHVVILLPSGKSASLETLLDAAQLVLQFSGGSNWGKTEIDYTFRKYVKRIKDSSEVSYTHNKTLLITPDPIRLKRLL